MQQITPRYLKEWLDDNERESPILIDVRDTDDLVVGRFANALCWPLNDSFNEQADNFIQKESCCVLFCTGFDNAVSAALNLETKGFCNLYILLGGIDAWKRRYGDLYFYAEGSHQ